MINVTKTFLPPLEEYSQYLEKVWKSAWITNNGELVRELEDKLNKYFEVPYVKYVSNGTIALQVALKALNIKKEVITTPFSYVATTNSILWEGCKPVFVDIENRTFCIDADKIEEAITEDTEAILATHVYGYPCDVLKIQQIARKHNLHVIYDAAHAFGVKINDVPLVSFGDIATLSFHATKLFHTGEGGAIISHQDDLANNISLRMSFGHLNDEYSTIGINGKNSELHAAMGLATFPYLEKIIARRKEISTLYDQFLENSVVTTPSKPVGLEYNYSYYPVVFTTERQLQVVQAALKDHNINCRRYFYPSLNKLPFVDEQRCPISEDIAKRVLCLPLFYDLQNDSVEKISKVILSTNV